MEKVNSSYKYVAGKERDVYTCAFRFFEEEAEVVVSSCQFHPPLVFIIQGAFSLWSTSSARHLISLARRLWSWCQLPRTA